MCTTSDSDCSYSLVQKDVELRHPHCRTDMVNQASIGNALDQERPLGDLSLLLDGRANWGRHREWQIGYRLHQYFGTSGRLHKAPDYLV